MLQNIVDGDPETVQIQMFLQIVGGIRRSSINTYLRSAHIYLKMDTVPEGTSAVRHHQQDQDLKSGKTHPVATDGEGTSTGIMSLSLDYMCKMQNEVGRPPCPSSQVRSFDIW